MVLHGLTQPGTLDPAPTADGARGRYEAYCRRQAAQLLRLMPREAIRPLYRRAVAQARSAGEEPGSDPLAFLTAFCQDLLPLPPFDVWREDERIHAGAYLGELADGGVGTPSLDAPSTLATRTVEFAGLPWRAHLRTYRDEGVWRGFMAFEGDGDTGEYRTTAVFREEDPSLLRDRFLSFEPAALAAFLRSSLP